MVGRVEIQPVVREDQALCPAGICAVGVDIALGIAPAGLLGQQPLAVAEPVAADGGPFLIDLDAAALPAERAGLVLRDIVLRQMAVGVEI